MKRFTMLAVVLTLGLAQSAAHAQSNSLATQRYFNQLRNQNSANNFNSSSIRSSIYTRSVPTYAFSTVNRGIFNSATQPQRQQKPFSSVGGGPSVTPYLALSSPFSSTATNYYTQVRPMVEQQRINQQNEQRAAKMQQQLTSVAATAPYSPKGDYERAPTGHAAVFMNYGGYYPMPVRR